MLRNSQTLPLDMTRAMGFKYQENTQLGNVDAKNLLAESVCILKFMQLYTRLIDLICKGGRPGDGAEANLRTIVKLRGAFSKLCICARKRARAGATDFRCRNAFHACRRRGGPGVGPCRDRAECRFREKSPAVVRDEQSAFSFLHYVSRSLVLPNEPGIRFKINGRFLTCSTL